MSPLALSASFLQTQPDRRLAALAREGHEAAFEVLVRRYRRELLAYCRKLQPQAGNAEDALQQTLLQAWRALTAGAEVRAVRPWFYRIAHNVVITNLRAVGPAAHEISEDAVDTQQVDQLVEQRLMARAALASVASLPTIQRQAFVSTTVGGASHDDVASALGLSSGAVRSLIYRARAAVRAGASAITPSPLLTWAVRHAESRGGGAAVAAEAVAGGGGAALAGVVLKGGAVITLVGAVAGAGGVILSHTPGHHHQPRPGNSPGVARSTRLSDPIGFGNGTGKRPAGNVANVPGSNGSRGVRVLAVSPTAEVGVSLRRAHTVQSAQGGPGGGRDGGSGGSGGPSSHDSGGSRDGGSSSGTATATSTSSGSSSGGSSGSGRSGSSGNSSGSSSSGSSRDGSNLGSGGSGPDGGRTGASGSQVMGAPTNSGGSAGSDGGSSGRPGSSDSGDATRTGGN